MNQLQELRRMGIQAHLNGSDLELEAPQSLSQELWEHGMRVARENKSAIICSLELENLCTQVEARLEYRDAKPTLVFDPPILGSDVDPERWELATELEDLFWLYVNLIENKSRSGYVADRSTRDHG